MNNLKQILNKNIDINIKTNLNNLRILSSFLTEEFMTVFDAIIEEANSKNKIEVIKYKILKNAIKSFSDDIYGSLIDSEKQIIEEMKKIGISDNIIVENLSENSEDEKRIKYICKAINAVEKDELEKNSIIDKLDKHSLDNLLKLEKSSNEIIYSPVLYKFFWCLYSSLDRSGEIIFTQDSLGQLLELGKNDLEEFLDALTELKVDIKGQKKPLIEYFAFLNKNTLKIEYNLDFVKASK